jgi:hypothetical protein
MILVCYELLMHDWTHSAQLLDALLDTGKPVVLVLEGGRPFAIPVQYARAAAVMLAVSAHNTDSLSSQI